MNPIERIEMFKFRKKTNCFDTIRAEELQVGDRFVFNSQAVEVAYAGELDGKTIVLMETTHLGSLRAILSATLYPEMFITVARR
jgi:hypothetical protein